MSILANTAGDPDTYAEAIAWSVIAVCATICYVAWRFTGGKHYGERDK